MKLEEIEKMWSVDCQISDVDLAAELARIPSMHQKYMQLLSRELLSLKKEEMDLKKFEKDKWLYYRGIMTDGEMRERGWKPFDIDLLKSDVDRFIDADQDIINMRLLQVLRDEKVSVLRQIVSALSFRNNLIKSMIEWRKFESGN